MQKARKVKNKHSSSKQPSVFTVIEGMRTVRVGKCMSSIEAFQ